MTIIFHIQIGVPRHEANRNKETEENQLGDAAYHIQMLISYLSS